MVHTLKVSCDSSRWTKTDSPGSPSGRYGHRSVVYQDKMILHGGYNGKDRLNDTFEFDLEKKEWKQLEGEGATKPCARDCHSAVLYKDQMFVFGGGDGYAWKNDVWVYNITKKTWQEIKVANGSVLPSGRAGHSAVVYQNKMLVFGGWNGRRTLNDLYSFDLDTYQWTAIQAKGQLPQSRDSHTSCIYSHFMYIVGGGDGKQRLNDMYQYDIRTNYWTRFDCIGEVNAGRAGHVAIQQGHRMIIFGGGDGLKWLTDVYECDIKARKWYLSESTGDIAPGSYGLSAVAYKNKMIIFGGGDGKSWYNSVYQFVCCDEKSKEQTQNNLFRTWGRGMYQDLCIEFTDDESQRAKAKAARTNAIKFHAEPDLAPSTSSVAAMSEGLAPLTVPSSMTKPKRRKDSPVRSPVVAISL